MHASEYAHCDLSTSVPKDETMVTWPEYGHVISAPFARYFSIMANSFLIYSALADACTQIIRQGMEINNQQKENDGEVKEVE